jgi:hypothetical protein
MPHRITGLSKKILDVLNAEHVPNEVAFAALSRAAINLCESSGKHVEWFTHTTLTMYEEFLIETVRRTDLDQSIE